MTDEVYILGASMTRFARHPEVPVERLGAEAALAALDDASLSLRDVQGLYAGNVMQANAMVGQRILREIGQTGIPVVNCSNACATGGTAMREAFASLRGELHYENLGLCEDGEGGRLIDEKRTWLGGDIPVNVSGGLLSKGHPAGATGVANIYEVTTHLRGEAGDRQVQNARLGLTHVVGFGASCAVHVLERA